MCCGVDDREQTMAENSWTWLDHESEEFALPADLRERDTFKGKDCGWVEQMRPLIQEFSKPGATILDPFSGFGTTLIAAALEGRKGIGIEMDPVRVLLSHERLQRLGFDSQKILSGSCLDIIHEVGRVDLVLTNLPYFGCNSISTEAGCELGLTKTTGLYGTETYTAYLEKLSHVFTELKKILKPDGFIVAAVQNIRLNGITVPQAWDIGRLLAHRYQLCNEQILVYGNGSSSDVPTHETNRAHEYVLIAQNQSRKIDLVQTLHYLKQLATEHTDFIVFGSMARYLMADGVASLPADVDLAIPHHPALLSRLIQWFELRGFAITRWGYPYRDKVVLADALYQNSWYVRAERLTSSGSLCIFDLCFGETSTYFDRLQTGRKIITGIPISISDIL